MDLQKELLALELDINQLMLDGKQAKAQRAKITYNRLKRSLEILEIDFKKSKEHLRKLIKN